MRTTGTKANNSQHFFLICLFFVLLSFLLFWPVLNKNFASDDFSILYRIVYHEGFFIKGFFRPLSDISLYTSWLMGAFNPLYYNVANVIVHASCACIMYRLCMLDSFLVLANRNFFAWLAALLFLIYPFHNEAVVWAIGRGIVLSGFFGFLALLVTFLQIQTVAKYLLSYLCYFIALCGYETVMVLPAIVIVFLVFQKKTARELLYVAAGYFLVLLGNLLLRMQLSGPLWTAYGGTIFKSSPGGYIIKMLKTGGRLLLPPAGSSFLLGICFAIVIGCIIAAGIYLLKSKKNNVAGYTLLGFVFFISLIIPAMFGISTKTYEGDRVLYFPSFFLCIWIAYVVSLCSDKKGRRVMGLLTLSYFLFFFYQNILTWRESGNIVSSIIKDAGAIKRSNGKIYLLNMPEEYNGVPVFRNGFTQALLLNQVDTTGIEVINRLGTDKSAGLREIIMPVRKNGQIFIPPHTYIYGNNISARRSDNDSTLIIIPVNNNDKIYYWNRQSFVLTEK